ncbi:hypothetical protein M409DRAFT_25193 [Zasmidium cellare ATCC 36951]|uniref:Uncharacterized protein n=1 Tax=Zasmidium cellare ATCC 36951 TaxID=1080233 RepID=A0A6A6CAW3_ZASCE|nr:uncharacterized protein M409DRAFT_25193 [Zasmidium cellare ATCC 36951]KAF2164314.1 hypothetical protein M409DRAFT_25193 [Zasmidium cellare ATCC 36951]
MTSTNNTIASTNDIMASQAKSETTIPTNEKPQPRSGLTLSHYIVLALLVLFSFVPYTYQYFRDRGRQSPLEMTEKQNAKAIQFLVMTTVGTGFYLVLWSAYPEHRIFNLARRDLYDRCRMIYDVSKILLILTGLRIATVNKKSFLFCCEEKVHVGVYDYVALAVACGAYAAVIFAKRLGLEEGA